MQSTWCIMKKDSWRYKYLGILIALSIMISWSLCLYGNFTREIRWDSPLVWLMFLLQTHLFTGLFITAHDAMHGALAPKFPKLNHILGRVAATLFLFNNYDAMRPKHYAHHRHVGTELDPDFHKGSAGFFSWYKDFLMEYISWKQIALAAIFFNLLKWVVGIGDTQLVLYWVIPSLLSTFQLFYFGTFVPHMGEHASDNLHKSHSLGKNHAYAFLSCYFFGYHYEHHDKPGTPWWLLWREKEQNTY